MLHGWPEEQEDLSDARSGITAAASPFGMNMTEPQLPSWSAAMRLSTSSKHPTSTCVTRYLNMENGFLSLCMSQHVSFCFQNDLRNIASGRQGLSSMQVLQKLLRTSRHAPTAYPRAEQTLDIH